MLAQIKTSLTASLGPIAAQQAALGQVYTMLVRQATVLSYIDCFRLLAYLCMIAVPTALLFKRVKKNGKKVEIAAH
jgi:DHA2 family multidrug resistance protein